MRGPKYRVLGDRERRTFSYRSGGSTNTLVEKMRVRSDNLMGLPRQSRSTAHKILGNSANIPKSEKEDRGSIMRIWLLRRFELAT
jgi:hypothetical protein